MMRIAGPSLALSLLLLAAPAVAQSSTTGAADRNTNRYTTDEQQNRQSGDQNRYGGSQQRGERYSSNERQTDQGWRGDMAGLTSDTRSKIRHSLEQSGFKNVKVVPQAYLIRAQAPDGSRIVMEVTPDFMHGIVMNTGSSANPADDMNRSDGSKTRQWHFRGENNMKDDDDTNR